MAKKDILKNLTEIEFIWALILLKPKSDEGSGRFDAKRLYETLREIGPSKDHNHNSLDRMMPVLRGGHTIYQHSDQMHTEIYYVRDEACNSIKRELEKRLGFNYLQKFGPVARKIWQHYDSLVSVRH